MDTKKNPKWNLREEALKIRFRKSKFLSELSGRVLFPRKLEEANKIVSNLKWKD